MLASRPSDDTSELGEVFFMSQTCQFNKLTFNSQGESMTTTVVSWLYILNYWNEKSIQEIRMLLKLDFIYIVMFYESAFLDCGNTICSLFPQLKTMS